MIGISFWRVFKSAMQNFWRNIWLSVATTVIMSLTLLMMSFLYFANILGAEVIRSIEQKVDLSAVFKPEASDQQIKILAQEFESRQDVETVRIVSSDDALALFRERHADDPFIEESLKELEENPLPASIFIVATEPRFYQNIATQLQSEKYSPFIESVNFENSKTVIDRLIKVMTSVKNAGFIATVIFAVLVVLIMFNTIRLAIYSFREEIDIMRLVGASNWFIQGPFLIEAIVVALLGVVICNIVLFPFLSAAEPQIRTFFFSSNGGQFNIYDYAVANWPTLIGIQAGLAVFLAGLSSMIAIRRYLRK
ncbi:MAG: ABC transporter permease [Candidatus Portnoybacteria bacterium]|nr:ABC transporter permease [Candidatus Portnoybacteria bacterium]